MKLDKKDSSKKLFASTGMELTFMPREYKDAVFAHEYHEALRKAALWFIKAEYYKANKKGLGERTYVDGHVIEIPTEPFTTMRGLYEEYMEAWTYADKYSCVAQSEVIATGSNHINVELDSRMRMRLIRDIANRPYLLWCFQDPCDVQDSASLNEFISKVTKADIEEVLNKKVVNNQPHFDFWDGPAKAKKYKMQGRVFLFTKDEAEGQADFKDSAINYGLVRYRNLHRCVETYNNPVAPMLAELRFFEAPKDWVEAKLQMDFVDTYLHWLDQRPWHEFEIPKYFKQGDLCNLPFEQMKKEFIDFLKELRLPVQKYKKYIDCNLTQRYALGKDKLR